MSDCMYLLCKPNVLSSTGLYLCDNVERPEIPGLHYFLGRRCCVCVSIFRCHRLGMDYECYILGLTDCNCLQCSCGVVDNNDVEHKVLNKCTENTSDYLLLLSFPYTGVSINYH